MNLNLLFTDLESVLLSSLVLLYNIALDVSIFINKYYYILLNCTSALEH